MDKNIHQPVLIQSLCLRPYAAVNVKRIDEPNAFLAEIPGVEIRSDIGTTAVDRSTDWRAKVFIWQRPILDRVRDIGTLQTILNAGYLLITEFDDDPDHWPKMIENDYLSFRGVHMVQTATERLASYLRQFNPAVAVFPNQMAEVPDLSFRNDGKVNLLFAALNRHQEWQQIMPLLNRVIREYDARVQVQVVMDQAFYDALETRNKSFEPVCDYARYTQLISAADINLLPLNDTKFNGLKSDLKFIESAAYGAVALAQETVYADSIQNGMTGLIYRTPDEFASQLRKLLKNAALRRRIVKAAHQYARKHRMHQQHIRSRYQTYLQAFDQRAELGRAIAARCPGLVQISLSKPSVPATPPPESAAPRTPPGRDYHDRINPDLLALLPPGLSSVLEVGCGTGAFAAAYCSKNPGCDYYGLEINSKAAEIGQQRGCFKRIIAGDAERTDLTQLGISAGSLSAIVYGDTLEHLQDPWTLLARHAGYLAPEGTVAACIPNIGHYSVILALLQGKWNYTEEGLLDRTQLRFFTLESITQLFQQAGLEVLQMRARTFNREAHARFLQAFLGLTTTLGMDPEPFKFQTGAYQYLILARRPRGDS